MNKKIKVMYFLSEEGRKDDILKGGSGAEKKIIVTECTPKLLSLSEVDENGDVIFKIGKQWKYDYEITKSYSARSSIDSIYKYLSFDRVMSIDELIEYVEKNEKNLKEKFDILEKQLIPILEEEKIQEDMKNAQKLEEEQKRKIKQEERELKLRERNEIYFKEKSIWIKEYGSEYLKTAFELGYNVDESYVIERTKKEYPEYEVDYNSNADWEVVDNPSKKLLFEANELKGKNIKATVVSIKSPIDEDEYDSDYFEEYETIVIQDYLRSTLIKKI